MRVSVDLVFSNTNMCCVDEAAGQVWTVELEHADAVCLFMAGKLKFFVSR